MIKDDENEKTLDVNTTHFDLLQKANRIYYNNNLLDKTIEQFVLFATNLHVKVTQEKFKTKLTEYTKVLTSTLTMETYNEQEVIEAYKTKLEQLYKDNSSTMTLLSFQNDLVQKIEDFRIYLKNNFANLPIEKDVLEILFQNNTNTLLGENVFNCFTKTSTKSGFVQSHLTQSSFDNVLLNTRTKLIASEISNLLTALKK